MLVKQITNKQEWENFVSLCQEKTFLHSWNWAEFQKMMGEKIWRMGVYDDGQNQFEEVSPPKEEKPLVAAALVVLITAKRGRFLFVPHGPIIKIFNLPRTARFARCNCFAIKQFSIFKKKILKILLDELKKIAKEERCGFIRIAPVWERTNENKQLFKVLGFKQAPLHAHPELTWVLDLNKSEDELLRDMRKTTRYLIKQGLKNRDLAIEKSEQLADIEQFNQLYQATVNRHHFQPFSLDYLKNEFSAFSQDNQVLLFLAKYKGECLAAAVVIFWQGVGFYHQGASSLKYPKIAASYLLQWQAIKQAKQRGCQIYNFWGIAPSQNPKHPWYGLSLFKKGFGGEAREYVKTQDLPLTCGYWLTYFFEKLRKLKRGL